MQVNVQLWVCACVRVHMCVCGCICTRAGLHVRRFTAGVGVQLSFSCVAYPCVLLQYFGQTAYLVAHPQDVSSAFWSSVPEAIFWPLLAIGTLAAIVASQAKQLPTQLACACACMLMHTCGCLTAHITPLACVMMPS